MTDIDTAKFRACAAFVDPPDPVLQLCDALDAARAENARLRKAITTWCESTISHARSHDCAGWDCNICMAGNNAHTLLDELDAARKPLEPSDGK